MNFVKERGGCRIVDIEITKEHKILCRKVGKRWKGGKCSKQLVKVIRGR